MKIVSVYAYMKLYDIDSIAVAPVKENHTSNYEKGQDPHNHWCWWCQSMI